MKFIRIWILNPLKRSGGQPDIGGGVRCLGALHWKSYQRISASDLKLQVSQVFGCFKHSGTCSVPKVLFDVAQQIKVWAIFVKNNSCSHITGSLITFSNLSVALGIGNDVS